MEYLSKAFIAFLLVKNYSNVDNFPFLGNSIGDNLQVLGKKILDDFNLKHAIVRGTLNAWLMEAEEANWTNPQDIKNRYPTASFLEENKVIFNIKGNHYRLIVVVDYQRQIVIVSWVGTHAEYSKKFC